MQTRLPLTRLETHHSAVEGAAAVWKLAVAEQLVAAEDRIWAEEEEMAEAAAAFRDEGGLSIYHNGRRNRTRESTIRNGQ